MNEEELFRQNNYVPDGIRVIPNFFGNDIEKVRAHVAKILDEKRVLETPLFSLPDFISGHFQRKVGGSIKLVNAKQYSGRESCPPHVDGYSRAGAVLVVVLSGSLGTRFFKSSQDASLNSRKPLPGLEISDVVPLWDAPAEGFGISFPESSIHASPCEPGRLIFRALYSPLERAL